MGRERTRRLDRRSGDHLQGTRLPLSPLPHADPRPRLSPSAGLTPLPFPLVSQGKAAQYLSKEVSEGVGDYEPVMEALRRYGLAHFGAQFRADGVDAAAFRSLGEAHLTRLGITSVGDRIKVLEAAREMRDEEVARTAAAEGARATQHAQLLAGLGGAQPGAPTGV